MTTTEAPTLEQAGGVLTPGELKTIKRYQDAVNYLSAAQIYLKTNPLLEEPLKPEHIKDRLLGHWGTAPGINMVYAHLNRLILKTDASVLRVTGPGHGAAASMANMYIEGAMTDDELNALFTGYGYAARIVDYNERTDEDMTAAVAWAYDEIRAIQTQAREGRTPERPCWPMIILRMPKGLGGPKEVDGKPVEGSFLSHQVHLQLPRVYRSHQTARVGTTGEPPVRHQLLDI